MEKKKDRHPRVILLPVPSKDWETAALALTHEAKNLYNTLTFIIRQIVTAYDYDRKTSVHRLKDDLHSNQTAAISAVNDRVREINEKRLSNTNDPSKVKRLAELAPVMSYPLNTVLDVTLLDNVAKQWIDGDGQCAYRRLPAASAQQVVRSVIDAWKGFISSLVDWSKHPEKYAGRPSYPNFLHKDGHFPLEIPFASITKGFPKPRMFHDPETLGNRSVELQELFYEHDLRSSVQIACQWRGWDVYHPQHIRLIEKAGKIKIEAVVDLVAEYPQGSFLSRAYDLHGDKLSELKRDSDKEKLLLELARSKPGIRLAGLDVGENNVATVVFSTGNRALVHSGERSNALAGKYQALMDKRLSGLTTPRMKELQRMKQELMDKGERFPKHLNIELRKLQAQMFADPLYRSFVSNLDKKRSDLEHKITTDIVEHCVRNRIDVLVVGQNKGMKQGNEWGRQRNRKSHAIAHARLLSLLRYKLEKHGIAVLTTEESYTSKSSFVDNDVLKTYTAKENRKIKETTDENTMPGVEVSTPADVTAYSGRRSTKDRNWFVRHKAVDGVLSRVHADVNGAFNIIRKLFTNFRYHPGLSLKFNVRRISPRLGAVMPLSCQSG